MPSKEDIRYNETTVLANIILDQSGDILLKASSELQPDDFSDERNELIYDTMLALLRKGSKIDFPILVDELKNLKRLEIVGGTEYLNEILRSSTKVGSIDPYVTNIKDNSLLNKFKTKLNELTKQADTQPITDIGLFLQKSEREIVDITQARRAGKVDTMENVTDRLINKLVDQTEVYKKKGRHDPRGVTGLNTGYGDLDYYTKGWHNGEMVIIGARPSVGKTAFALNLSYNVAKQGVPVLFLSLEMSAESIAMRLLSLTSGLSSEEINAFDYLPNSSTNRIIIDQLRGQEDTARYMDLKSGVSELASLPLYIDDSSESSVFNIVTKCRQVKNSNPELGLIVIDYLGLIQASKSASNSLNQAVSEISRELKKMARELDIPVIVLSQLNRASASDRRGDNHVPLMSELRDSGSIEQDADMVLLIYREDYAGNYRVSQDEEEGGERDPNAPSRPNISLVKNRNGATGDLVFSFDKVHCKFVAEDRNR